MYLVKDLAFVVSIEFHDLWLVEGFLRDTPNFFCSITVHNKIRASSESVPVVQLLRRRSLSFHVENAEFDTVSPLSFTMVSAGGVPLV